MWPDLLLLVLLGFLIVVGLIYWSCHRDRWKQ